VLMSLLFTVGFKAQDSAGTTGAGHLCIANPDAFYAIPHTLSVPHGFVIIHQNTEQPVAFYQKSENIQEKEPEKSAQVTTKFNFSKKYKISKPQIPIIKKADPVVSAIQTSPLHPYNIPYNDPNYFQKSQALVMFMPIRKIELKNHNMHFAAANLYAKWPYIPYTIATKVTPYNIDIVFLSKYNLPAFHNLPPPA